MLRETISAWAGVAFSVGTAITVAGCNVDGRWIQFGAPNGPLESQTGDRGAETPIPQAREVDLVETLVSHRTQYQQTLRRLHDYYLEKGYATKARWAAFELSGLRRVKQFRYLLDAEVPSGPHQATESVPEADALYEQGKELMRRGGHGIPGFYREDRMIEAANVLRELVERYPTSDKIDDAAFLLGEIHKEYFRGMESIAVKWYERAWTWNPQTPRPARFHAALLYDYRLHDRDRALELYRSVVEHETKHRSNVHRAMRRIHQLTRSERTAQAAAQR